MYGKIGSIAIVLAALAGCSEPQREWMKINQQYTTAEFRRDHAACMKSGKLDETCMRGRGWVDVSPPKAEKGPEPEPSRSGVYTPPQNRGR